MDTVVIRSDTTRISRLVTALCLGAGVSMLLAQSPLAETGSFRADWRRIGNSAVELNLASPATGPAEQTWFSEDGSRLYVRAASGRVFETTDFENWRPSDAVAPEAEDAALGGAGSGPEALARMRSNPANPARVYAFGRQVYRSDDGGRTWNNLTAHRQESIIGGGMRGLAVSPHDGDEVVVANERGVWRSLDGGLSWSGLNQFLPNLPVRRLAELPSGTRGVRVLVDGIGEAEWAPGEKRAWRPAAESLLSAEIAARGRLSEALGVEVTALASGGEWIYAGAADGSLWVSLNRGQEWRPSRAADGIPVEGLYVDAAEPRLALAARGSAAGQSKGAHVLRTANGGLYWDDLSANLPDVAAHAVVAHRATGTLYVATDRGVWFAATDLSGGSTSATWTRLGGNLPSAAAFDVRLDAGGNQLFTALDGHGVFATMAPHRLRQLRVVNAADFSDRPAAPGTLLSVLGSRVESARAGDWNAPVLAVSDTESQIQVPFEARGATISLALQAAQGRYTLGLAMESASPAVFVDRDGTPMLLDADSGVLLDAMTPARSNYRIQILATGLGRVRPDWPTGVAAPLEQPPQVAAPVRVFLDRAPVEVTRATLAPGYIGFYLVEVRLPALIDAGPAELYLEVAGRESNRVRVYLAP